MIPLCLFFFFFSSLALHSQVVINEVRPIPTEGEPEWVELYNPSTTKWSCSDCLLSDTRSTIALPPLSIPAKGYMLLCRNPQNMLDVFPFISASDIVPCSLPSLNNTTDAVVLRTADSAVIDSFGYSTKWVPAGASIERISPDLPPTASNVSGGTGPLLASPAMVNSLSPLSFDAVPLSIMLLPPDTLVLAVANRGSRTVQALLSLSDAKAEIFRGTVALQGQQTVSIPVQYTPSQGWQPLTAIASAPNDQRRYNDTLARSLYVPYDRPTALINEIMFDPQDGMADWVELVSVTSDTLNLSGWALCDASPASKPDTLVLPEGTILTPNSFLVCTEDSAGLNITPQSISTGNGKLRMILSGDAVYLLDPGRRPVDSVSYSPQWHSNELSATRGISLERLSTEISGADPANWRSSGNTLGATPGTTNSMAVDVPLSASLQLSSNPWQPATGPLRVQWNIPFRTARITATVLRENGEHVALLANALYSAAVGSTLWDGATGNGAPITPGRYIVSILSTDSHTQQTIHTLHILGVAP